MKLLLVLILLTLLAYMSLQILYVIRKYRMHQKEKQLLAEGNEPFGSGLSHGMVVNENRDGVIEDSKKSAVWYSRLV